ncbi:phytanoyl-CoA dioxygenase family protein [Paenibacillus sp. BC26]|uniref:phytanoyl-CoA dioxygenase family protein n=1 Tax=Paenibacillus sp. BC26 TaxID=1881032 RepID=UPI0008E0F450|nr:phytanoyl-CoA dioxygenase family protein [Paenibacillus sp. BC26]SFS68698.1 Phytanoyl-CoA dioxygenase (PhyH) [Paenibacillus sp. BC26]
MSNLSMGKQQLEWNSKYLTELRDSNSLLGNVRALKHRLEEDGYILLRSFHDRNAVNRGRMDILQQLSAAGCLDPHAPMEEGVIGPENRAYGLDYKRMPAFLDVVNAPKLMSFFDELLGGKSITYDHKWIRAIQQGANTGAHYDRVYMGRGTQNLYTVWTPFGDIAKEQGTLAITLGSQHWDKVKNTYGQVDSDSGPVKDALFSRDPYEIVDKFGGRWGTTDFEAGDIIMFGMFTMHASLDNNTNRYRLSSDTRYQLESEPKDMRWIGKDPIGHKGADSSNEHKQTMAEARKSWGLD